MKLPELLGSEKQVKWANDIRHEYIDQLAQDEKLVEKYLELKEKSDDDLKRIRNMSEKCYKEIKQAVYCTDCKRSIYGEYRDCDLNMKNGGKYLRGDYECHCKVFTEE